MLFQLCSHGYSIHDLEDDVEIDENNEGSWQIACEKAASCGDPAK